MAHDSSELDRAPTLESYFFQRIRPIMERALAEQRRDTWPLIVLNLDFKQNDPELLDAVYTLLGRYEPWLTTAPRTSTPSAAAPLAVGPLLVLAGSTDAQRARFHDAVPVGGRLRAFGAIPSPIAPGATDDERDANMGQMPAEQLIAPRASNYARWVNFPWRVVESEGQPNAGDWSSADSARLRALVTRAHAQNLWIRFYTLDGFLNGDGDGLTQSYDFGSDAAVKLRWRAALAAGADFIATDHYERVDRARRAPRFSVLAIAELFDPKNPDGNEIHRPYVEAAKRWLSRLAADSNFAVSYLESPNTITDGMLDSVDMIWQMNYPPFRWSPTAKAALEKYLSEGKGGWLGVHHASLYGPAVTNESWPWFRDSLLGGIDYRDYVSKFASGTVRVEDAAHPVFAHVPSSFRVSTEEWYVWDRSPRAKLHVLASVDEGSYAFVDPSQRGIRMGGDHPVVWTNGNLKGRNLYVFMGHHPDLFSNPAYTTLLTSSIMWLATKPATRP